MSRPDQSTPARRSGGKPAALRKAGRASRQVLDRLRRYESPNVTFMASDGSWPIVWERAGGESVWDADGRRYVDLTAAFGVAAAGHANRAVVRAGQRQMEQLLHAMGDVHPHAPKARLARELSRLTFERWSRGRQQIRGRTIFCNSGFEAVEAALKTAVLATGRRWVVAFEGAYHGLGHGALNVTHRDLFRRPFLGQLAQFGVFLPYPTPQEGLEKAARRLERVLRSEKPGAVLLEPVQARGGIRILPAGYLRRVRKLCDAHGVLLILDEIYTGFGRTGRWFACEPDAVVPDLICLGKALTGGFPLSACVGRSELMESAWPISAGEAMHTSTFLGHPVGCAMALAQIREIRRRNLVKISRTLGESLRRWLRAAVVGLEHLRAEVRGAGLMAGVELRRKDGAPAGAESVDVVQRMLHRGFVLLPEGEHGEVVSLTPPLTIQPRVLQRAVRALAQVLQDVDASLVRRGGSSK